MEWIRRAWKRLRGCRRHEFQKVPGLFIEVPGFRKKAVLQCKVCGMVGGGRV